MEFPEEDITDQEIRISGSFNYDLEGEDYRNLFSLPQDHSINTLKDLDYGNLVCICKYSSNLKNKSTYTYVYTQKIIFLHNTYAKDEIFIHISQMEEENLYQYIQTIHTIDEILYVTDEYKSEISSYLL